MVRNLPLVLLLAAIRCSAQQPAVSQPMGISEKFPWSLQHAVAYRQLSVVSMLVSMGVNVNLQSPEGNRPLDVACLNGDAAIAKFLLEHRADPNLRNQSGSTPLHDAALKGNQDVIALLLAHGAAIDATDRETGSTALHHAASFDRLEAVQTLIQHGADAGIRTNQGFTALQLAEQNNFSDVVAFLKHRI